MLFGPVLFWLIVLFSAALGLPRHFVREEELGTADLLRLALSPHAVYGGKWAAAVTEVWLLEVLLLPLLTLFLDLELRGRLGSWSLALFLGGIGLASSSSLLSSIAAQARSPSALFAALAIPVLLPLLMLLVGLAHTEEPLAWTLLLLLYDGLVMAAGFLLFPAVWRR
jgi:heme exporter protein B